MITQATEHPAVLATCHALQRLHRRLTRLRDHLQHALATALPDRVHLNGHPTRRLPNTVNLSITGITGGDLLNAVPGVAASAGSACHAGTTEPSPVLTDAWLADWRAVFDT